LILLDGLNETPGKQREQAIGAIANLMREYPEHRYVVTSRSQDELWRKLRSGDLIQDAVVVQNISDAQAQRYLEAHLGKATGQGLYQHLDDSLKSLARTPLLLWLFKEAGQGSNQLPRNRGELFDKFVMNRLLEREKKLETMEKAETKKRALAQLAFSMQLGHQLSCDRAWAEQVLNEKGWKDKADAILNEALVHGLILQQDRPGQQQLRFMHQSVQEYFVARKLQGEVAIERSGNFLQNISRQFSRHNLAAWARDTWWSESFVQLAGLVEDADWLARRILNVSPWLAWWCVQEGREVKEETREKIETRSIKLLSSARVVERRRAVQTLAQIQNERAMEPLLFAAGDEDREVAGLAVKALVDNGESARPFIQKALQGEDRRAWKVSFRYLGTQPYETLWVEIPGRAWEEAFGQPMIWVPAGTFLMGSDESRDSKAYDDELPQHSMTLPGYWIGRLPVTVAQWKLFVKESGHRYNSESVQDPDTHPVRYVSWQDALAYCNWLSEKSSLPVGLPSEAEWEKAARGTDGRIYPWGNEFDKDKCNTYESGIGNTTPVGKYSPAGDSPYGCADMAGNVWEWTRSKFKPYPYNADDERENLEGNDRRVVRGGSWLDDLDLARASYRLISDPRIRLNNYGFRVVVRPPSL
jgi:formylglycine-generating enzyme required for sulfatase activity